MKIRNSWMETKQYYRTFFTLNKFIECQNFFCSILNARTDANMVSSFVLSENGNLSFFLAGYSLFLALIIDRLHHYIREWRGLRKSMEAAMKQNRLLEEAKSEKLDEIKGRDEKIMSLNEEIQQLKLASEERMKEVKMAEANAIALRKQSEGLLLEYDRLLEDNQNLRSQLQSIDHHLSHSDSKKNA